MKTRRLRTQGLTLVEVAVSSAILALLALALMSATIPLSNTSREQATSIDLDRDAGKFMAELRRELRQSGVQVNGVARVRVRTVTATNDTLDFYIRTGPLDTNANWRPDEGGNALWTAPISYRCPVSTQAAGRRKITRTDSNLTSDLIDNVQSVVYTLATNSKSVTVTLTLVRKGIKATTAGAAPADIVRVYTDQIELMNVAEN